MINQYIKVGSFSFSKGPRGFNEGPLLAYY